MADRPVVLVTGSSRGIGRYLSDHYLARGYDVIGCSRTAPSQPMRANFVHVTADVTVAKDVERLFADIRTRFGRLDVAINNAGINSGVALSILTSHEIVAKTLMTNVLGTFGVSREAAKLMMRKKFGRIINFSSMAARHEVEGEAIYAASKAAIQTMTRVMAKEFYRYGITCNAVAPSAVPTDMMESVPAPALKEVLARNAIPEVGKMEDISNAIDWLIRPESQAITGQVVFLGGRLRMPNVHTIVNGEWRENCYVMRSEGRHAVVIDPGEDTDVIVGYLEKESLTVDAIINTHAHYDHVGSVADIRSRYNAPFHLHAGDHRLLKQVNFYRVLFGGKRMITIPDVDVDLAERSILNFGRLRIEVIRTPGHTPGSVSFLTEGLLFSGDTLFGSRVGRTDLPGGDKAALGASVRRLLQLPPETIVFPGHGPCASLAEILSANREAAELLR